MNNQLIKIIFMDKNSVINFDEDTQKYLKFTDITNALIDDIHESIELDKPILFIKYNSIYDAKKFLDQINDSILRNNIYLIYGFEANKDIVNSINVRQKGILFDQNVIDTFIKIINRSSNTCTKLLDKIEKEIIEVENVSPHLDIERLLHLQELRYWTRSIESETKSSDTDYNILNTEHEMKSEIITHIIEGVMDYQSDDTIIDNLLEKSR